MDEVRKNILEIKNVEKSFNINGEELKVLNGVNFDVREGEFISIIGSSGCGKSTLLNMISSLESITNGEIILDGENVRGPSDKCSVIFQESRLFPWMTVEGNIEFTLSDTLSKAEKKEIVKKHINLVGLSGFEKAYPSQLSGGMQQRVSIARGLATNPQLLLLDEPFGALDAFTRINMQEETLRIWKEEHTTMILVTHDIDEAIYLSDRIVVLSAKPGVVKEIISIENGRPRDRISPEFGEIRRKVMVALFDKDVNENIEYYI
jgi:sulfonate transport system ATP-binding protein